jgi:hypothetical protein
LPRASLTDRFEDEEEEEEEGNATVITKIAKTVKPATQTPSFMSVPPESYLDCKARTVKIASPGVDFDQSRLWLMPDKL